MPLLVVGLIGVVALLLAGRGEQTQIIGAGSTLAQPLIESSAAEFRDTLARDNPTPVAGADTTWLVDDAGNDWVLDGSGIRYEPVGSLGGIMRLTDPEVDFAVADYPLSAAGLAETGTVQFPIALGAVAVVHTLDLPEGAELRLDAETAAAMYLGEITRWDDERIAALNPDLELPGTEIVALHRGDGSGSTKAFTEYLADGSSAWADGPGSDTEITWPGGEGAERSSGLIERVRETPGAIGYVEQGQARRAGLDVVALGNTGGGFVGPDDDTMRAAVSDVDFSGADDFTTPLTPSGDPNAYPVTVAVYAMVREDPDFSADTGRTLRFLAFVMEAYDADAADLGYLPLPADAARAVQAYWADTLPDAL